MASRLRAPPTAGTTSRRCAASYTTWPGSAWNTIVNLIYTVSPRHNDEYYARKVCEAAAIHPYRICFKDVGGLLTPERARTLLPAILKNAGDVAVEYHAHCNNGLATLCYLEAVKLGIRALHTAVPPLANGSSQPVDF